MTDKTGQPPLTALRYTAFRPYGYILPFRHTRFRYRRHSNDSQWIQRDALAWYEIVWYVSPSTQCPRRNKRCLREVVQASIKEVCGAFVRPSSYTLDVDRLLLGREENLRTHAVGVLHIIIHGAEDLPKADTMGEWRESLV